MRPDSPSDPRTAVVETTFGPVAYTDEGSGTQPVVAIHGLPGSSRDFRWLAPAVLPRRTIRIDLPGFGDTPASTAPAFDPESRAELVVDFIRALDIAPCILLGHSMGGVIATIVAADHPQLVSQLVLVASPGRFMHRGLRRMPRRLAAALVRPRLAAKALAPVTRSLFTRSGFRGPYPDAALRRTLLGVAALDIDAHADRLHRVKVPTLVVSSRDDPLIEPEVPVGIMEVIPHARALTFDDGGHNPQKHHANEIAAALAE